MFRSVKSMSFGDKKLDAAYDRWATRSPPEYDDEDEEEEGGEENE